MPEEKKFSPSVEAPATHDTAATQVESRTERTESPRNESGSSAPSITAIKAIHQTLPEENLPVALTAHPKDLVYTEVEHVLEEGLGAYYQGMNPKLQQMFKSRGEELTTTLAQMVKTTTVNLGKVVELIRRWLMLIPGVSRFFLEQEAKIRADRIAMIAQLSAERQRGVKRS